MEREYDEDDEGPQPGNVRDEPITQRVRADGFAGLVGMQFEETAPDHARIRLAIGTEHLNYAGMLHGGVLATLIDSAIVRAARGDSTRAATTDLNVTYLRAARRGTIVVEAWVLRRGKTIAMGEAEVLNDRGELLAKGRASVLLSGETAAE